MNIYDPYGHICTRCGFWIVASGDTVHGFSCQTNNPAVITATAANWTQPQPAICGTISNSGARGEPLGCGFPHGHSGVHAWATLPTFPRPEIGRD